MCVEVCVSAAQAWQVEGVDGAVAAAGTPCQTPLYPPRTVTSTPLHIYDDDNILQVCLPALDVYLFYTELSVCVRSLVCSSQTLPLLLELEFPVLRATPSLIDLHVVADGDTRKCYFTVTHSSRESSWSSSTNSYSARERSSNSAAC